MLKIYFSGLWRDSSSTCDWALCDESGRALQQGHSRLADIPQDRNCVGILAADRVLTFTALRPPGNKRRWSSALPFIAEEHTLNDPDDIHASANDTTDPELIALSVVSKSWLKQIVVAAKSTGHPLRRVIAETFMPALSAGSWALIWDGSSGFLRTSSTTGLALDNGNTLCPPQALLLSFSGVSMPDRIELRCDSAAAPTWNLPVPLVIGEKWDWRDAPVNAPNLLCGEFTPPLRLFDGLSKLRPALLILLLALTIEVIGTHIEWALLTIEKQTLTQNITQIFHRVFGDDSTLVDAPLQMQRNLAALRHEAGLADDTDFLSMLDTGALSEIGAIHGLSYESGRMEFDITLKPAADFKSLESRLKSQGFGVKITDTQDTGNGMQGKISLTQIGLR